MSEYADCFDDGKGEKFDELMEEIVILREKLKECHENGQRLLAVADSYKEELAALREQLEKAQSEYICSCGIRVTPHRCPTDVVNTFINREVSIVSSYRKFPL